MSKLYALFVGINRYVFEKPLFGCVEDTKSLEQLFRTRVAPEGLELLTLYDAQATRAAIIDGFRTHLARAGADDAALFYYCGHGSLEWTPVEWEWLEPSKMNRTLVPVDARGNGVYDLADKELSALLTELAAKAGQVVVITDACHSAGSTRSTGIPSRSGGAARMAMATNAERTLADYLPLAVELYSQARIAEHGRPQPRHIAIAACQQDEIAWETPFEAPRRGAFSAALEAAITQLGPTATYADLVDTVRMKVRPQVAALAEPGHPPPSQVPNLYCAGGASAFDRFLQGAAGRRNLGVMAVEGEWYLMAGAIDGTEQGITELAIFERTDADLPAAQRTPVATAIVADVQDDRARLTVTPTRVPLDLAKQYVGELTRVGRPSLHLLVDVEPGASEARRLVRTALAGADPRFALAEAAGDLPTVTVVITKTSVALRSAEGEMLAGLTFALDASGLADLVRSCSHIARWHHLRDLRPAGSLLNDQVVLELVEVKPDETLAPADRPALPVVDGAVQLHYNGETPARVQYRFRNNAAESLFVAVMELSDDFEAAKIYGERMPAGSVGLRDGGRTKRVSIADWHVPPAASGTLYYKIIATVKDMEAERWTLPPLIGATMMRKSSDDEPVAPPVRGADGAEAFWGTTLLRVVTHR